MNPVSHPRADTGQRNRAKITLPITRQTPSQLAWPQCGLLNCSSGKSIGGCDDGNLPSVPSGEPRVAAGRLECDEFHYWNEWD